MPGDLPYPRRRHWRQNYIWRNFRAFESGRSISKCFVEWEHSRSDFAIAVAIARGINYGVQRIIALWLNLVVLLAVPVLGAAESLAELRSSAEKKPKTFAQESDDLRFAELRAKAGNGDAIAQLELGRSYAYGFGTARDGTEAINWLRKAAEQGNVDAQYSLGLLYSTGIWLVGVAEDYPEAMKWFRKAADQGNADAEDCIGGMYELGRGVPKNDKEAVRWYRMAAEKGVESAQSSLAKHLLHGEGVPEDGKEAMKWYRKAADQGNIPAQYMLGVMYASGETVPKNDKEAVRWYRMAAEKGDDSAQYNLGIHYANGEGVLKDEIEALAWFNLSAVSGYNKDAAKNRDILESRLGQQATLIAQQRSKEILKQIESTKAARAAQNTTTPSLTSPSKNDTPKASGSGAIVSPSGYVLTAAHVVAGAARVMVITAQGAKAATVVRVDEANDLAVLKIGGGAYAALPVSPSRRIRLGQSVATIGFPNIDLQGSSPKLTRGEISSLNGFGDDPRGWQISAPVQPGNSGGPLLDENGNLIGVVVAKLGLNAANAIGDIPQNVNYAVKSAYALALLEPYLDASAPEPMQPISKPNFEDMVAKAQQSVVLILVY